MRQSTVAAGGIRFAVRQAGRGEPLLLLHGLGATGHVAERLARELRALRLIAPDLPGHGRTPRAASADLTPEGLAAAVAALLDRLRVRRFAVLGHSMGASVGIALAATLPERVSALCLVDGGSELGAVARIGAAPVIGDAIFGVPAAVPANRAMVRLYLERNFGDPAKVTEAIVDDYLAAAKAPGFYRTMLDALRGLVNRGATRAHLARIRCPVSILWGECDRIIHPMLGRRLARKIPRASFHLLPGVGHCPIEEAPEIVAERVIELLAARDGVARRRTG